MPWNPGTTPRSRFLRSVAGAALALASCAGLAGCGGGGSGGGGQVMIVPDPQPPAPEPPDLVVEPPEVSGANPTAGAGFTLSARVRNAGGGAAPATTLRFYRSDDAAISTLDTPVSSKVLKGLAAGGSVAASADVTAPQATGTHHYGACVDAAPDESDAGNNCSPSVRVTVSALRTPVVETRFLRSSPAPDLVVERFSLSNADLSAGMEITSYVLIRNLGDWPSARTRLRYYRSDDNTITPSDTEIGAAGTPPMGDWGSAIIKPKTLRAPSTPGTYYYGACLDAVSGESDTSNNCSKPRRVTVPRVPPDLVIVSPHASPADPPIGGGFTLNAAVRNAGGGVTAVTKLRFYHSTDETITTDDTEVGAGGVTKLAASMMTNYYLNVSLLSPSTPGTYYYGACVDTVFGEVDTTNNCSAVVKVEVSHKAPDLRIHAVGLGPGSTEGKFKLIATLRNAGGDYQGNTWLRFYRSADRTITTDDTEVGAVKVERLYGRGRFRFFQGRVDVAFPSSGTYYFGACVDAVTGESDTSNNCSHARGVWSPGESGEAGSP